ncbi:WD40 repeat domain-containing protein [Phanerochaete sordida]|uniref:WD40 repeat domain-containing protein n=1 Tax=Phanerochaete sordida TaxID=48140 RepID=A0A9P3LC25_9APHY|nr:WD40 repeat domain-containing protein [Phanerochaete sordida]
MEFGLEAEVDWAMSPQSDRLAIAPKNGVLKVCSTETGKELLAIDQPNPLSWPVAFSADGTEVLAVCDEDNSALVYGSQTGDLRRTYSLSEPIYTASFSPKGDYVAFGGVSGDIEVYDAKSTTFLVKFEGPRSEEGGESETHWLADGERFITFYTHGPVLMRSVRDALRLR